MVRPFRGNRAEGVIMSSTLIVFTRYPEPGRTKTRLAGVLGDDGAAELHQRLAEHALAHARAAAAQADLRLEIHHTGDEVDMASWLGDDLIYRRQSEGDLGQKMASAMSAITAPTVIMGTDCPDLDQTLLATAFETLQDHDLVLGPAADGGYYLIGMGRLYRSLFENIVWGGDQVLSRTLAIAEQRRLSVFLLPVLADIDRPEDLARLPSFLRSEG